MLFLPEAVAEAAVFYFDSRMTVMIDQETDILIEYECLFPGLNTEKSSFAFISMISFFIAGRDAHGSMQTKGASFPTVCHREQYLKSGYSMHIECLPFGEERMAFPPVFSRIIASLSNRECSNVSRLDSSKLSE